MKDEVRNWDNGWDEESAGEERCFYIWNVREYGLTLGVVLELVQHFVEDEECSFNIITPYSSVIDGWLHIGRPREPYWTKLKQHRPRTAKQRKRMRQAFEIAKKRVLEKEDYMESWRKRMRRLSF